MIRISLLLILMIVVSCATLRDPPMSEFARAQTMGICHVHHVKMKRKSVPVVYGLIHGNVLGPMEVRLNRFPHAQEWGGGGCVIMNGKYRVKQWLYVCPECQKAEQEWLNENPELAKSIKRFKEMVSTPYYP